MVYAQPRIRPAKRAAGNSLAFWYINRSPNPCQTLDRVIVNKNRTCWIVDFAVLADHRMKLKEGEKKDKYLDLARKLKKLWKIKVTVILNEIGALYTVTKGLVKGLEELEIRTRVETIQTTALLRSARILRKVLEFWGDLPSLKH